MKSIKNIIINIFSKYVPAGTRRLIRNYIPMTGYDEYNRVLSNPYANEPNEYTVENSPWTIGIVIEKMQYHQNYISACREIGISYKLLDLFRDDWIDLFLSSGCDAFLIWPSYSLSIWKEMFDDRCRILEKELGQIIYPTSNEIWLYENKRRTRDWLKANNIPHPRTWIFFNEEEALSFARNATLPLVFKTNIGAGHSGVWILRRRAEVESMIKKTFSKGIVPRYWNPMDRQWCVVYLQEYLPNVKEWRMVRIGESYFCRIKEKIGDFHSGSGKVHWGNPSIELLNFTRMITEKGRFTSMDVDVFETINGDLLVNELQSLFGAIYLANDELMGKYHYDDKKGTWEFTHGFFYDNACANARLDYLVNTILPSKDNKC